MTKAHLKRLVVPRTWPLKRKGITFVAKPQAGKLRELAVPLVVAVRDMLGVCQKAKELSVMLHEKGVEVGGKVRSSKRYPVGLYEVVSFIKSKKAYRLVLDDRGKLSFIEVKDPKLTLVHIQNKTTVKGKSQLNGSNSFNMIVDKDEYTVGDTIVVDGDKIKERLPFEKGALVQLISGKHIGAIGHVEEIRGNIIVFKKGDDVFETKKAYAFVIGKKKPAVQVADNE